MSSHAVLVATAKVRPGTDTEFSAWKTRHDLVVGKFPGFVSSDIIPPTKPGGNEWTIILNFRSQEELTTWERSPERAEVLAEGLPLFEGGNLGEVAKPTQELIKQDGNVTEVIFSKVKPGMEDAYREWSVRIQAAQAKYPGYQGMYLQPPEEKGGLWTTIIRFETAAHLEGWMAAPERKELLRESKAFIEHEQLTRLATSFPGWVPVNPETGKGPPDWKTAMLVLLGLFPIVMLEMKFLSPIWSWLSLNSSFATFVGNSISVAATSFVTMPLFVRWFGWWLFLNDDSPRGATPRGVLILIVLFAIEIAALWKLLPW
ncbi:MAG TPA: antibiotic biosynthesis monooxygenase [Chthoniobacterales bacterium]|jgi:antibiotic biosynthesis monooxygenase (ABM) superfamily enzyme|nr:antibiotic biosynthesis monooxygenase [Chthoniobacterales bacterium]